MAKRNEKKVTFIDLGEWEVTSVRELDFGTFFTLKLEGIAFFNLRVVPAGKNYDSFIAVPQHQGKDKKWYPDYALYLSPEDTADILEEVEAQAKKNRK